MFGEDIFEEMCIMSIEPRSGEKAEEVARIPVTHKYETENSFIAAFELPGVEKENIELNLVEDRIEVKVERKRDEATENDNTQDIKGNRFYGAVTVPSNVLNVLTENITASYNNGILRVEIPKAKKQELKIEIK